LSRIALAANESSQLNIRSVDIFLVLTGTVEVNSATSAQNFDKGEAFAAVSGSAITLKTFSGAEIYRASVPANS